MAFGTNRAAPQQRASFQTSGGIIIKFRHPYLSGQVSDASPVDEIDVSKSVRLNDTFFSAVPLQDSAVMEALVDGSTITITNHMLAGRATLNVLRTTGLVGSGDLIAALQLIIASKDSLGGTLTIIRMVNGKRIITVFYGVSVQNVPHLILAGNAIVPYAAVMLYSGFFEGVGADNLDEQTIWAVGNKNGISAKYRPYAIQAGQGDLFSASNVQSGIVGGVDDVDSPDGDIDNGATPAAGDGLDPVVVPSGVTWPS